MSINPHTHRHRMCPYGCRHDWCDGRLTSFLSDWNRWLYNFFSFIFCSTIWIICNTRALFLFKKVVLSEKAYWRFYTCSRQSGKKLKSLWNPSRLAKGSGAQKHCSPTIYQLLKWSSTHLQTRSFLNHDVVFVILEWSQFI